MSCIDSAIIKALVEHIGMNPDEIPTGGANSPTLINATWSTKTVDGMNSVAFKLPEGQAPQIGMCLKINGKPDYNYPEEFYIYCVNITDNSLTFALEDAVKTFGCTKDADGRYVFGELWLDANIKTLPDNKNFGLFKATSFNDYIPIIHYILTMIDYHSNRLSNT